MECTGAPCPPVVEDGCVLNVGTLYNIPHSRSVGQICTSVLHTDAGAFLQGRISCLRALTEARVCQVNGSCSERPSVHVRATAVCKSERAEAEPAGYQRCYSCPPFTSQHSAIPLCSRCGWGALPMAGPVGSASKAGGSVGLESFPTHLHSGSRALRPSTACCGDVALRNSVPINKSLHIQTVPG
jgi:hypothetical protein